MWLFIVSAKRKPCFSLLQYFLFLRHPRRFTTVAFRTSRPFERVPRFVSKDLKNALRGRLSSGSDGERLKKVISELDGKSVDDVIAQGREKLAALPVGGAAPAAAAAAPGAAAAPAEEKKEEKKPAKEESESEDDDMGFGLFD
ncbi:hypothetical protein KPH14_012511 [Odynerus spinipes]|uniref:Large ribosomal subunit protein P2 n=1 Tax=Odynerus spinipes TaxID=1348599 RepID=A0AAD9RID6_9HYME|nr:hypothetical protein KPH14_012511 [Odynerus spinipes]